MFVSVDAILSFKHTVEIALDFCCFCANRFATHLQPSLFSNVVSDLKLCLMFCVGFGCYCPCIQLSI